MRRLEWGTIGIVLLWLVVILFLLAYDQTKAQDEPVTVCQAQPGQFIFHIPAAWNDPALASWWALGDGYSMRDETTVIVDALMTPDVYGEGQPEWLQNLKAGQALVGSGDYSQIIIADAQTPSCDAKGYPVILLPETPVPTPSDVPSAIAAPLVVSTGRTCVIQYPKIILVCND